MIKLCELNGCDKVHRARGLCSGHYDKWRKQNRHLVRSAKSKWFNPDGSRMGCTVPECPFKVETQGMCSKHYQQFHYESTRGHLKTTKNRKRRDITGEPLDLRCTFEECNRREFNPGLCAAHYYQKLKRGFMTPINEQVKCALEICDNTLYVAKSRNNVCSKHSELRRKYGLSEQDLVNLFEDPQCANPGCGDTTELHIDHDHACCPYGKQFQKATQVSCGKCVRALLCRRCNLALGNLQENPRKIQGLLDYLERF